ncbi:MAG TPA: NAD(P)H-binding protein [Steroidobacteraceae bacterium]|nr:NAD(P)H-binding protein [Steroidobacteraceae bacterium]
MDLVVGATGFVGGLVARQLSAQGRHVRALVRGGAGHAGASALAAAGVAVLDGDLTDFASVARACAGCGTVVCTATAMPNAGGDALRRIDHEGVLNLIAAAEAAGVARCVYISYSRNIRTESPLSRAKRGCEARLESGRMDYVILQPSFFMEVWLGPHLGFDVAGGHVRIYGDGKAAVSYVSGRAVAAFATSAATRRGELREKVQVGGPEPLSQLEAVAHFERALGRRMTLHHVPVSALEAQHRSGDPLQQAFAALMLGYAQGDAIPEASDNAARFGVTLTSLADYAAGFEVPGPRGNP